MDVEIRDAYITLSQFLKKISLVSSGGEVKFFIESHNILVNNEKEIRRGRKLVTGDSIKIGEVVYTLKGTILHDSE